MELNKHEAEILYEAKGRILFSDSLSLPLSISLPFYLAFCECVRKFWSMFALDRSNDRANQRKKASTAAAKEGDDGIMKAVATQHTREWTSSQYYNLVRHTTSNNLYSTLVEFSIFGRLPSVAILIVYTHFSFYGFSFICSIFLYAHSLCFTVCVCASFSLPPSLCLWCVHRMSMSISSELVTLNVLCVFSFVYSLRFLSVWFALFMVTSSHTFDGDSIWKTRKARQSNRSISHSSLIAAAHTVPLSLHVHLYIGFYFILFACIGFLYLYVWAIAKMFVQIILIRSVFPYFRLRWERVQFDQHTAQNPKPMADFLLKSLSERHFHTHTHRNILTRSIKQANHSKINK